MWLFMYYIFYIRYPRLRLNTFNVSQLQKILETYQRFHESKMGLENITSTLKSLCTKHVPVFSCFPLALQALAKESNIVGQTFKICFTKQSLTVLPHHKTLLDKHNVFRNVFESFKYISCLYQAKKKLNEQCFVM